MIALKIKRIIRELQMTGCHPANSWGEPAQTLGELIDSFWLANCCLRDAHGTEGCLSTPILKYDDVCCVDFRFWRGATREHPPKWGCDRGVTKPEPKSDATLRAAVLFGPDVVARSLQTPEGYARRSRLVWPKNPSPQTSSYL